MRDPFGFDRDSGREGAEHGRPIGSSEDEQGSTDGGSALPDDPIIVPDAPIVPDLSLLNLDEDLSFEWGTVNEDAEMYQYYVDLFNGILQGGNLTDSQVSLYTYYVSVYEEQVAYYQNLPYQEIYLRGDATIDYSLNLDVLEPGSIRTSSMRPGRSCQW
jgi:hypothetical protein